MIKQGIIIGRPINGIAINGLEYVLDENDNVIVFEDYSTMRIGSSADAFLQLVQKSVPIGLYISMMKRVRKVRYYD